MEAFMNQLRGNVLGTKLQSKPADQGIGLGRLLSLRILTTLTLLLVVVASFAAESPYDAINAEAATAVIETHPIRGGLSMLEGSGGNITVLAGADGTLMVDGGIALSRKRLEEAINALGPGPIKYVINTHWHWDHTDSNAWLHQRGAILIGHPNTAKNLASVITIEDWGHTFEPVPADARPTVLVNQTKTMEFDGEDVEISAYQAAHTNGDLAVYFKKANVVATGDTYWNGHYPFIDYAVGGSINGMIAAARRNIDLVDDKSIVVPGHGPLGTRADLIEYKNMLVDIRDKVSILKKGGMSLDQVIAEKPSAAYDAKWGDFVIGPPLFLKFVYLGV
jgi:glyoxylase-like metal-dependent hydrolase (beta-lactamase superfamily II)